MDFRWHYVDDSGSPQTGWIVYGYLQVGASEWNAALKYWLDLRRHLQEVYAIPTDYEIHSVNFINGRGNPSTREEWNRRKWLRHQVAAELLEALPGMPGVRIGAVHRHTDARRDEYARERQEVYAAMINCLNAELIRADEYGSIIIDGNGTEPAYRAHHRKLDLGSRRINEDALFLSAHLSQLVQVADLIAYTAYQAVQKDPRRAFMHNWFERHLSARGDLTRA